MDFPIKYRAFPIEITNPCVSGCGGSGAHGLWMDCRGGWRGGPSPAAVLCGLAEPCHRDDFLHRKRRYHNISEIKSVCLSVWLSACLPAWLSVCLSVCMYVCMYTVCCESSPIKQKGKSAQLRPSAPTSMLVKTKQDVKAFTSQASKRGKAKHAQTLKHPAGGKPSLQFNGFWFSDWHKCVIFTMVFRPP